MPVVRCDCNAGMERFIKANVNVSASRRYYVYFDLRNPDRPNESRRLRVLLRSNNAELLSATLNDNGGLKPTRGLTRQYRPNVKPNPKLNKKCHTERVRVFYAEINLTSDSGKEIIFNIVPATSTNDVRRFLSFAGRNVPADLQDEEILLNSYGGKKPLEGGIDRLRRKRKK